MKIWLASSNNHKKKELEAILAGHEIALPASIGIDFDPEETGTTFLENALLKARALYDLVHEPVIADDSGICVDALEGRPGVYSARYGGDGKRKLSDQERNELLLGEMRDVRDRKARFVCAMALIYSPDRFILVQETMEGELTRESKGAGGFGYDPILYIPDLGKTVAELTDEEKNRESHRAKAGMALSRLLSNNA